MVSRARVGRSLGVGEFAWTATRFTLRSLSLHRSWTSVARESSGAYSRCDGATTIHAGATSDTQPDRGWDPMATLRRVTSLALFALLACADAAETRDSTSGPDVTSLIGTWEMTEFEITRGSETTRLTADPEPLALTVYTPDHFAYVWKGQTNAGAGTYVFDGATIRQTFQYLSDESLIGSVFTFRLDIEGDIMRFSGPVEAVSASGDDITDRIPQMLEVRRRTGSDQ